MLAQLLRKSTERPAREVEHSEIRVFTVRGGQ